MNSVIYCISIGQFTSKRITAEQNQRPVRKDGMTLQLCRDEIEKIQTVKLCALCFDSLELPTKFADLTKSAAFICVDVAM